MSRSRSRIVPVILRLLLLAHAFLITGCGSESGPPSDPKGKFTGVALTVRCADSAFASAIGPAVHSWADRSGASVALHTSNMTPGDDTDIGILSVSEFGIWADRRELARVPSTLRLADHPYQWTGVLPIYRDQLSEWGGQAQAIPLAGDGHVIVYRTDRLADEKLVTAFLAAYSRKPRVPTTWEEFVDLAVQLSTVSGKPSIAPMTALQAADLLFRIAACYDRPASSSPQAVREGSLSLQFDVSNAQPRLQAPGFAAAGALFDRLAQAKCFAPMTPAGQKGDRMAALRDGGSALAVLSLTELAELPRENGIVLPQFGIAALPGTKRYHDSGRGMIESAAPNYVPYHAGGRLGVVRTRSANIDAAFDLLADLGGPARSLEIVGTPGLGAGPIRIAHLERERIHIWYGYGFDASRTNQLQSALQQYVRQEVKSPALGLRGPDQEALANAAAVELGKLTAGERPDEALRRLTDAWNEIDKKTPQETRLRWRKMAAGGN
jgi:multiple sugar transport system substrate-binding protein